MTERRDVLVDGRGDRPAAVSDDRRCRRGRRGRAGRMRFGGRFGGRLHEWHRRGFGPHPFRTRPDLQPPSIRVAKAPAIHVAEASARTRPMTTCSPMCTRAPASRAR